jgi:hypothetical protein
MDVEEGGCELIRGPLLSRDLTGKAGIYLNVNISLLYRKRLYHAAEVLAVKRKV